VVPEVFVAGLKTNAITDPSLAAPTKSSAMPTMTCRVASARFASISLMR